MQSNNLLPAALRRSEKRETPKLLLDRRETAEALGISQRMLDTLTEPHGPLKPVRVGRRVLFSPAVLQRWINTATCAAVTTEAATYSEATNTLTSETP